MQVACVPDELLYPSPAWVLIGANGTDLPEWSGY